jgi:DNA-binding response OmpR family regulator
MAHKILVVDDDSDITETLARRLMREGFEVATAYSGEEGLQKAIGEKPDVVLLDLMMPGMNGFEVLKELRKQVTDRWVPVIIVSAQNDLDSVRSGYGLDADHYLTKPCGFDKILSGINTMLSLVPLRKFQEGK